MTPGWWLAALLMLGDPAPSAAAAASEATAAPLLANWHGEWAGQWAGEGTAFGKPATATFTIGPAPGDGVTRLAYRLSIAGAPPLLYSAEGLYRVDGKARIRGTWTDSQGCTRPIAGRLDAGKWSAHWGSADVEIGRSTYALETHDRLVVNDSVLQDDGSWRVFATIIYRRQIP